MLCGARSLYAVFQWGRDNADTIAGPLGFTRAKLPCHASLHYIFGGIDAQAFEMALYSFFRQYCDGQKLTGVSVDGKKLRGIHGEELPCVHLVSAFAHELGIPLLQRGVQNHEGELTAARDLLQMLALKNVVITGDSLYCQRDVCETIVEKGGII